MKMVHEDVSTYCTARNLIIDEFTREYPDGNVDNVKETLSKYPTEAVVMVADVINRFGLRTIMDIVGEKK